MISNEIHGVGGTDSHDVGFLRLSAGGGSIQNKSYIDLCGYNSNIITLGTADQKECVLIRHLKVLEHYPLQHPNYT